MHIHLNEVNNTFFKSASMMGMNYNLTVNYSAGCTTAPKTFFIKIVSNDPYEEIAGFGSLDPALSTYQLDNFILAGEYGAVDVTLRD